PGFSLHRELKRMEAAGMTPYEIIESGTSHVGRYFAESDDFGTIAEGQRADLLLVNANPLDDVAHISERTGVMVRGHWLSEDAIQTRLAEIAAGYANGDS
ncbi:MAG TPA: amidohydrolase family protein, partial [Rhodothermales bacterium]|nr:amidohydrolase family protein [Rhodothermales bacterium]